MTENTPTRQRNTRRKTPIVGDDGVARVICDDHGNPIPRTKRYKNALERAQANERRRAYMRNHANLRRQSAKLERRALEKAAVLLTPPRPDRTDAGNATSPGQPHYDVGAFLSLHHAIEHVRKPQWQVAPMTRNRKLIAMRQLHDILRKLSPESRATITKAIRTDPAYANEPELPTDTKRHLLDLLDHDPDPGVNTLTPMNDRTIVAAYFAYKFSTYDLQWRSAHEHSRRNNRNDIDHPRPRSPLFGCHLLRTIPDAWRFEGYNSYPATVTTGTPLKDALFGYTEHDTQPGTPEDTPTPFNFLQGRPTWALSMKNLYRIAELFDRYGMFQPLQYATHIDNFGINQSRSEAYNRMPPLVYMLWEMRALWPELHQLVSHHPHVFYDRSVLKRPKVDTESATMERAPGQWGMRQASVLHLEDILNSRMATHRHHLYGDYRPGDDNYINYVPLDPQLIIKTRPGAPIHPLRSKMHQIQAETTRSHDLNDYLVDSISLHIQEHFPSVNKCVHALDRVNAQISHARLNKYLDSTELILDGEVRGSGRKSPRVSWANWVNLAYVFQLDPVVWLLNINRDLDVLNDA